MPNNLIKESVRDLQKKKFCVPYYQRGYRWGVQQVQQLLDDVNGSSEGYFLQVLVVVKEDADDIFHIIDGQQRLTTIFLLLKELGEKETEIEYKRGRGGELDQHYKGEAQNTIRNWLNNKQQETDDWKNQFLTKVKEGRFLFYEVESTDEQDVFNRLNSGKIKLRDSELAKCVLLTSENDETTDITLVRAHEWDMVERELKNDHFFSFFTSCNAKCVDDRMAVLLQLAGFQPIKGQWETEMFPVFATMQNIAPADKSVCIDKDDSAEKASGISRRSNKCATASVEKVWQDICFAYYTLKAWYDDPLLYHAFGWFVHHKGASLNIPLEPKQILNKLEELNKQEMWDRKACYTEDPQWAHQVLLLFNVAYCWRRWPMRYDFLCHRNTNWSLEHIFARNQGDLNQEDFNKFCPALESSWEDYKKECEQGRGDRWLKKELKDEYPEEEDNRISNLALLGKEANSSLSNRLFQGKRAAIVKWLTEENGYRVPPATEAVFLKSLPELETSKAFWSESEKGVYKKEMQETINAFISALKKVTGEKQ